MVKKKVFHESTNLSKLTLYFDTMSVWCLLLYRSQTHTNLLKIL